MDTFQPTLFHCLPADPDDLDASMMKVVQAVESDEGTDKIGEGMTGEVGDKTVVLDAMFMMDDLYGMPEGDVNKE